MSTNNPLLRYKGNTTLLGRGRCFCLKWLGTGSTVLWFGWSRATGFCLDMAMTHRLPLPGLSCRVVTLGEEGCSAGSGPASLGPAQKPVHSSTAQHKGRERVGLASHPLGRGGDGSGSFCRHLLGQHSSLGCLIKH